jgi:hypothetical protein
MKYYTIFGKDDGFGAQYQSIMSGIAYCEYNNYIYYHTPFKTIGHNVDVDKLNNFIGINNDNLLKNNIYPKEDELKNMIVEPISHSVTFCKDPNIYYTDKVKKILRDYYYSTEKPKIDNIDIAIHIRRGDVNLQYEYKGRYTENDIYKKIIKALKSKYPSYSITIFSEGNISDFSDLKLLNSQFKLNTDICETYHSLVTAKILVTAKSSFSYSSAILNENIVYYQNFWHNQLDNWLNVQTLIDDDSI